MINTGVNTNGVNGINGDEIDCTERINAYGSNEKEPKELPGFCTLFFQALDDFMLKVLIFAAIISIALQVGSAAPEKRSTEWIEGFAVLMAVMISSIITAANDYQKERQFQKLNDVADARKTVSLKRNGKLLEIHQDKVLVGDIVQLSEGMEIPADGILI